MANPDFSKNVMLARVMIDHCPEISVIDLTNASDRIYELKAQSNAVPATIWLRTGQEVVTKAIDSDTVIKYK